MHKGLLGLGVVILVIGLVLAFYTVSDSRTFSIASFGLSIGDFHFTDPVRLPPGVTIKVSWTSNRDVTLAIATKVQVDAYKSQGGRLDALELESGTTANFEYTTPKEDDYVFAYRVAPFIGTLSLTATVSWRYQPFSTIGFILIIGGIGATAFAALIRKGGASPKPTLSTPPPPTLQRIYCRYCGAEVPSDSIYCRSCGRKISESF